MVSQMGLLDPQSFLRLSKAVRRVEQPSSSDLEPQAMVRWLLSIQAAHRPDRKINRYSALLANVMHQLADFSVLSGVGAPL